MKRPASELVRIGELAARSGLSPDTLRHYERLGLLRCAERTTGGFRLYTSDALRRVRTIQGALAIGFTLRELATLLRARASGRPPCQAARRIAGERLEEIECELTRLSQLRDALRAAVDRWDERLARMPDGEPALLLDSLADVPVRKAGTDEAQDQDARALGARAGLRSRARLRRRQRDD